MKTKLRIHKLNDYSRGIIITDWINANEIVNDTSYNEVEADFYANQIVLSLVSPVNARSAPQSNNELCPTDTNRDKELGDWTELSQEELEAKYPDYPTRTAKEIQVLAQCIKSQHNQIEAMLPRIEALTIAVEALQAFVENSKKKGASQ